MGGGVSHVGRQILYLDHRDTPNRSRSGQSLGAPPVVTDNLAPKRQQREGWLRQLKFCT